MEVQKADFQLHIVPEHLTKNEIESVNFKYADLKQMLKKYNPEKLKEGLQQTG